MTNELKVAVIGLDTSHAVEFTRRLQAPDCPPDQRVAGLRVITCLRFPTPFQNEAGLNARQQTLTNWGVKVTTHFEEAVAGVDAVMIEINDPAGHWEYFRRCAGLGKPVFLDKPLADTFANGRHILDLAQKNKVPLFSCSSLRFAPQLLQACTRLPAPVFAGTYGPVGKAPAGSGIVWYGVHAFEMLERAMGRGARRVFVKPDDAGFTALVNYPDGRRGIVELNEGAGVFGGCLRNKGTAAPFVVEAGRLYCDQLLQVADFFRGGPAPVALADTAEVMALLDAAQRSAETGTEQPVPTGA